MVSVKTLRRVGPARVMKELRRVARAAGGTVWAVERESEWLSEIEVGRKCSAR